MSMFNANINVKGRRHAALPPGREVAGSGLGRAASGGRLRPLRRPRPHRAIRPAAARPLGRRSGGSGSRAERSGPAGERAPAPAGRGAAGRAEGARGRQSGPRTPARRGVGVGGASAASSPPARRGRTQTEGWVWAGAAAARPRARPAFSPSQEPGEASNLPSEPPPPRSCSFSSPSLGRVFSDVPLRQVLRGRPWPRQDPSAGTGPNSTLRMTD
ncbi:bcl-2-binding component 3-like [Bos indicus x Bos taurus]|uniref:bcl-2-binding component 3-like n=1 Tax=Bos indicus x Bos taurus TaxID=30522 RepID=UPI000F7D4A99|nr:bcl-2-binding component 3-like [Bos indicus x Bos taurus]